MANVNVISVNPSQKTLGSLHPEMLDKVARGCRVSTASSDASIKSAVNLFFGISKNSLPVSGKMFAVRAIASAWFIISGIASGVDFALFNAGALNIILGGMIFLGLFTRVSALAAIGMLLTSFTMNDVLTMDFAAFVSANAITLISSGVCMMVAIMGPGFYSTDQIIRRSIFKGIKNYNKNRAVHSAEMRLSYKAFQYGDRM